MGYVNRESLVHRMRKAYPGFAAGLSDEQLYKYAVDNFNPEKLSGIKGAEFLSWDAPTPGEAKNNLNEQRSQQPTGTTQHPKTLWDNITNANLAGWVGDATDWNFLK